MDSIAKTRELLGHTESKLVGLSAEATAQRDYDMAGRLLATAQTIKRLLEQYGPSDDAPHATTNGITGAKVSVAAENSGPKLATNSRRKAKRLGTYPRFFRSGDKLVKVGWSKKDKAEYDHKCPKSVLSCLVSSFLSIGGRSKRFSMDEVLPLSDPADGSELPTYQIYVALAWLRSVGLVEQHGRQGYSVRKGQHLSTKVEEEWNNLPMA